MHKWQQICFLSLGCGHHNKKSITFCGSLATEQRSGLGERKKDELQKDKKGTEFVGGIRSVAFTLGNRPT